MDRMALITGAGSGIGHAIAVALASRGAGVIAMDSDAANCRKTVEEINGHGGTAYEAVADVRSDQDIKRAAAALGDAPSKLDVLINCAGILRNTPALEIGEEEWRMMLDIHLKGTFLVCKNFVPVMIGNGGGLIINTSSGLAITGHSGRAHYCAAKRAIHALTKCLALELAPHGIRAISLAPGPIDTPMLREGLDDSGYRDKLEEVGHRLPLGRAGRPEDVANLAVWLAMGGGRFIDGQLLHVNGGSLMY